METCGAVCGAPTVGRCNYHIISGPDQRGAEQEGRRGGGREREIDPGKQQLGLWMVFLQDIDSAGQSELEIPARCFQTIFFLCESFVT